MNQIYLLPSIYAHIMNGLLLFVAFIVFYNNYSKIRHLEPYKLLMLLLIFSLAVGVHGLSHLGLEKIYNFNPLSF